MIKRYLYMGLYICLLINVSCKKDTRTVSMEKIVTEWMGKTLSIPSDVTTLSSETNSVSREKTSTSYKILVYTDSTGCTSCKLKLSIWKRYIQEIDSIMPGQVEFLFYFQPKSQKELIYLLERDNFTYTIYIDEKGEINKRNNFPPEMEFQCFLLDKENKVVSIGNPSLNPKVWELYKQIITGNKDANIQTITSVKIERSEIEVKDLKAGKVNTVSFILKNTGDVPLLISHIDASCGCTMPHWEKKPIKPTESVEIKVEVKPDNVGLFSKTVTVYCNIEKKIIPLRIKGQAK